MARDQVVDEVIRDLEAFKDHHIAELKAVQDRLDDMEVKANRPRLGGSGAANGTEEIKALAQFARSGDLDAFASVLQAKNGLLTADDTAGGYLAPPAISNQIITAVRAVSPMRRLARIVTIGLNAGGEFQEPKETTELGAAWVGETETRTDTGDPAFGLTTVSLDELEAFVPITQRLLDDNQFDLGNWLIAAIGRKFGRTEGEAFSGGNGVKKPRGFTTYDTDAAGDSTRVHNKWQHVMTGAAAAITADSLRDLFWSLGADYRANSTWLMSSATAAAIDKLKSGDGAYMWRDSTTAGAPPTLLGRPVEIDENLPAVGAGNLPIWLGDWQRAYMILDRPGIRFQQDPFTRRPYVIFYAYRRVGGGASDFSAAKCLKVGT
jgi:HK97 family phage major capsid protein